MTQQPTPRAMESLIAAHPDVLQCVVITMADRTLAAHYVLRPAASLCTTELYDYLAQRVPADVSPVVRLRRHVVLPPTRNGTVDLGFMS